MSDVMLNMWEIITIFVFALSALVFLVDTHLQDGINLEEQSRFWAALLLVVCLYALYTAALVNKTEHNKCYIEEPLKGITIRL
jgi:heme A synthase